MSSISAGTAIAPVLAAPGTRPMTSLRDWASKHPCQALLRGVLLGIRNGTARLVRADYHDTVRDLCARPTRDFTEQERTEYHISDQEPTCPQC